ncbi:barstar family protein [Paenibacillus sp. Z6-24]
MLVSEFHLFLGEPNFYMNLDETDKHTKSEAAPDINNQNVRVTFLDGENCRTIDGVFEEFNEKFSFPSYFGWNWNALEECLSDLDWLNAQGHLVCMGNAEQLLYLSDNDLSAILDILKITALEWSNGRQYCVPEQPPMPFKVIFCCSADHQEDFKKQLEKADIYADMLL